MNAFQRLRSYINPKAAQIRAEEKYLAIARERLAKIQPDPAVFTADEEREWIDYIRRHERKLKALRGSEDD
jgi:hypothetical protein